jgi:hypothetical protein
MNPESSIRGFTDSLGEITRFQALENHFSEQPDAFIWASHKCGDLPKGLSGTHLKIIKLSA